MKIYGPIYTGKLQYWHRKALPVVEKGWTQEAEYPWRKGSCLVFRFPFTKPGFYIGLWKRGSAVAHEDESTIDFLLAEAMRSREAWKPEDGRYEIGRAHV